MTIHKVVESSIKSYWANENTKIASNIIQRDESGEPGTLRYESFFSDMHELVNAHLPKTGFSKRLTDLTREMPPEY